MYLGSTNRLATVFVGETCKLVATLAVPFPTALVSVMDSVAALSADPPITTGCWCDALLCDIHTPRPIAAAAQMAKSIPMIHTHRDNRVVPFCVFLSQELEDFLFSSLAMTLKRRQKSSPRSPLFGNVTPSLFPRMIGFSSMNLISTPLAGRAKTGVIGVMGGWRGCGVLGTDEEEIALWGRTKGLWP